MIQNILDTIIPQDVSLEMPAASSIDFEAYQKAFGIETLVQTFVAGCSSLAQEKYGRPFVELTSDEGLTVINAFRTRKNDVFSEFLRHLFRAYYTDRRVLSKIPAGTVPPYPAGNVLEPSDWAILEPVKARGPIYRTVL